MATDYASEEFQWPEVSGLRPADAARMLDDIEREAAAANKLAKTLASRKAVAKVIVTQVVEDYDQAAVDFVNSEGRRVRYTPSPKDHFDITDEEAFKEWAAGEDESYFDPEPRLREDAFRDAMRRRVQDGEPLPPGVRRYTETTLSRSSTKG